MPAAVLRQATVFLACLSFLKVIPGRMRWLMTLGVLSGTLQRHPVSTVVPLTLAAPVIAVVGASLYVGTPLNGLMIAGGLIAMTGVAIVVFRTARAGESA